MRFSALFACFGAAALLSACATSARGPSSQQASTTPYNTFQTKLEMDGSQTYLGFLKSAVKPGLDHFLSQLDAEQSHFPQQFRKWQTDWVAAGVGVAIRIDHKNYFFNVGYRTGAEPTGDVKSGRSYGVGPSNNQSDPSDLAYLSELSDYLKGEPNARKNFAVALLQALASNDPSGWSTLSEDGQAVATDFMAIYTAEADRHEMMCEHQQARSHPWEIDLAAATFASVYVAESGKTVKNGQLTAGQVKDWWAQGTQGSGIGETRRDRQALTQKITKALSNNEAAKHALADIESVVGETGNDVIQSVFQFLGNCDDGPTHLSGSQVQKLTNGFAAYIEAVSANAASVI